MKKKILLLCILLIPSSLLFSQVSGNAVYRDSDRWKIQNEQIQLAQQYGNDPEDITLSVSALYNAGATGYLAIFHLTQTASSARECDSIFNNRVEGLKQEMEARGVTEYELLTDMLSMVPVYSVEVTKKLFSKTYQEIPDGFEIQKNIHIKYKDPNVLDDIITAAAFQEIYDLVKVEYFVDNTDSIYSVLEKECLALLEKRKSTWNDLGIELDGWWKNVRIVRDVFYPLERYSSYQTKTRRSLKKKNGDLEEVVEIPPKSTLYYKKVPYKGFDIVFNPEFLEPQIQYTCYLEVKFDVIKPDPKKDEKPKEKPQVKVETKIENRYFLVTPEGQVKAINF